MPRLKKSETIAACGLDCGSCSIRRFPSDKAAAAEVIGWFKQEGWLKENEGVAEAIERKLVCCGCHGDRNAHWSADCWILRCCVDAKGLKNCSECTTFPCARLVEWSKTDESYGKAFDRLRSMHAGLTRHTIPRRERRSKRVTDLGSERDDAPRDDAAM
jgi:hypothetical protein